MALRSYLLKDTGVNPCVLDMIGLAKAKPTKVRLDMLVVSFKYALRCSGISEGSKRLCDPLNGVGSNNI